MTVLWVLDLIGYDARGGNASVFTTPELALAARPKAKWEKINDGLWEEAVNGYEDLWCVYAVVVDEDRYGKPLGEAASEAARGDQ